MSNKKKTKTTKGGMYIAVCCFAVIAAAIGYAGRKDTASPLPEPERISSREIKVKEITPPDNRLTSELTEKENQEAAVVDIKEEKSDNASENIEAEAESFSNIAVTKSVELEENRFIMPVDGRVVCEFSDDKLIFNEKLSDWRSHNGIDISCDEDSAIYAAADGVVSDIFEDSMGKSVKIEHQNGYVSVYSNLSEQIEVKNGEEIKAGDLIGKIGTPSASDFTAEPHLHFEILFNSEYLNPAELLTE